MKYQTEEKVMNGLRSIVRYPEGFDASGRYPAVLFLHGAGTIGNDIEKRFVNVACPTIKIGSLAISGK